MKLMARAKHPSLRLHGLKKKKSLKKYFLNLKERKYEKKIILNWTMARKNSFQIPKNKQRNRISIKSIVQNEFWP